MSPFAHHFYELRIRHRISQFVLAKLMGYSKRISMEEIEKNNYNLNISRYISTSIADKEIDLTSVNVDLVDFEKQIIKAKNAHNQFLKELGLPELP